MLIKYRDIKAILKKQYPRLSETLILDETFIAPPVDFISAVLADIRSELYSLKYRSSMFDCDDFALVTNAKVHLYRMRELVSLPNKDPYQYALGEAIVDARQFGGKVLHMINIFVADDMKIYFSEPQQSGKIWAAKSENDDVIDVLHVRI